MTEREITLPGLVDMHVHCREPGYMEAEDFGAASRTALGAGVVALFDMPNNKNRPTTTLERLHEKMALARKGVVADTGFYFGAKPNEELALGSSEYEQLVELFVEAGKKTFGLKLYCDITEGSQHRHGQEAYRSTVSAWLEANPGGLIITHTEGGPATAEMIDLVAREMGGRIHIPHISKRDELEAVIRAKLDETIAGTVTTGVCPHHLFLTTDDVLTWYRRMKPSLGSAFDREFLRANLDMIDVIETDHAPHTRTDKNAAQRANPDGEVGPGKPTCFGVPGLEAMLPLLLRAEQEGWMTKQDIIEKTSTNPQAILGIQLPESEVVVDLENFVFSVEDIRSKCGWSPYVGQEMIGRIGTVVVGGVVKVYKGNIIAWPGEGRILTPERSGNEPV